jgi:hypothetical protein
MVAPLVLSFVHARPILQAREEDQQMVLASLDLGLTASEVRLGPDRVVLPDGQWLPWDCLEEIAQAETSCFLIEDNDAVKIQRYSEQLSRVYSLMPTARAPTLLVSGIPMHRIQGTDPHRDTLSKLRTIAPCVGHVLDTCTGLGYTAIEAARTAEQVVTIELDPTVLDIARLNPWSQPLFGHPRIRQIVADTFDEIVSFEDEAFSRIIHDPPMFNLAGELYSAEFYRHLFRVLRRGGRLYHYIGDLSSKSGANVARGVVRRLQEAGFSRLVRRPEAFGVTAYK